MLETAATVGGWGLGIALGVLAVGLVLLLLGGLALLVFGPRVPGERY